VSDIEAVSKKHGLRLLKDAMPETYQAELSAGPSTVFLSRNSPTSEPEDSESTSTAGKHSTAADEHAADE
jgi:hypothetical protein